MPPLIESVTTGSGAPSAAFSVSAALGSTLVACVGAENSTPTITGGPTWTSQVAAAGGGYPHNVKIFTGPVTSGGSQSLTAGSSGTVSAAVYVISSPFVVAGTASAGGSIDPQTVTGLTVNPTNCLLIGVWGNQYGTAQAGANYTPPSGMTERADFRIFDFAVLGSFSEVLTTTGSVSRTATVSPSSIGWSAALIALADPVWTLSSPTPPTAVRRATNF